MLSQGRHYRYFWKYCHALLTDISGFALLFREDRVFLANLRRALRASSLVVAGILAGANPLLAADSDTVLTPLVAITGADTTLHTNILGHLKVTSEACTTSLLRLRRLLPQVRRDITGAATALGYYQSSSEVRFGAGDSCWQLEININPGPRVVLETVTVAVISADPAVQAVFADILRATPLQPGSPLHHGQYEDLKNALSSRAADNGFFAARFEQAELALDLQANTASVQLQFDPGPPFRFGALSIGHDGILADDVIRGLMPVKEGDFYSSMRLAELRQQLDASQYFRQVRVSPQLGAATGQSVPVDVELEMRPRHAWTGGLGFTTDTGPRARLSYENRFLNSRGHRLLVDSVLSKVRSQVDGNYAVPLQLESWQTLNFAGGYSFENNDSFESKRFKLETSLRNETANGWLQSLFVDLQRDDYIVGTQEDISVLTMLGFSLSKSTADNLINPSTGWKLFTQLRGATEGLLSDSTFVQFYGSGKHVMSFGRGRLLTRFETGATWIDETEDLPASLRYFAGGDQSIRGYDFRSLGPLDENGEVRGGKQLVVGSLEYDYLVRNNWRVAVFADSGNAFSAKNDLELEHSVGLGLRWLSPIGPVRVDLAHPINADESFRLHITMGPDL